VAEQPIGLVWGWFKANGGGFGIGGGVASPIWPEPPPNGKMGIFFLMRYMTHVMF